MPLKLLLELLHDLIAQHKLLPSELFLVLFNLAELHSLPHFHGYEAASTIDHHYLAERQLRFRLWLEL
jgi:hypothetical protein